MEKKDLLIKQIDEIVEFLKEKEACFCSTCQFMRNPAEKVLRSKLLSLIKEMGGSVRKLKTDDFMKVSQEFQIGKHNIKYIDSRFATRFPDTAFESRKLGNFQVLPRIMSDQEILSELNPGTCELGDILALLDSEDKELRDGNWNLFYVSSFVVGVFWHSDRQGWHVGAWGHDDFNWYIGYRVFSPATGRSETVTLHSDSLTLEEKKAPNPGSDAARDLGCKCPVMDNGRGNQELGDTRGFWISDDCKVHNLGKADISQDMNSLLSKIYTGKIYADETVLYAAPRNKKKQPLQFFNVGKYISSAELEQEYKKRHLVPADVFALAAYMEGHQEDHSKATQWIDAEGNYCYAAFRRWRDERDVYVGRGGHAWYGYWSFAGVPEASSEMDTSEKTLDTLNLEERVKNLEKFEAQVRKFLII